MSLNPPQGLLRFTFRMHMLSIHRNLNTPPGLRWFAFRMRLLWMVRKHPAASVLTAITALALVVAVAVQVLHGPGSPCHLVITYSTGRFPRWALACEPR